jgi:hypothetical protein
MQHPYSDSLPPQQQAQRLSAVAAFFRQVFTTMTLGMLITGATAWAVASNPALLSFFFSGPMMWVVILAPVALVWFLAARVHTMSFSNASLTFAIYSVVNGISLSMIFLIYELGSIAQVFFITAGVFGAMALAGYTTKIDLSRLGSILFMALIGLIIASVVNFFLRSSAMDYLISYAGVLIFCGLTAYDMQKLRNIALAAEEGSEGTRKAALMGALTLYLDFINLFLFLLRILGGRRD